MPSDPASDDQTDAVRTALLTLTSPWSLDDLAAAVGSTAEAVRPAVDRLVEGGTIEPLGEDERDDADESATLYGPRPVEDSDDQKRVVL